MVRGARNELDHWNGPQFDVLRLCLSAAVPLYIAELRAMSEVERARTAAIWARDAVDPLASGGDRILHRVRDYPEEPGTAKTFNCLARGIAALAQRPGGVEAFGMVFGPAEGWSA